MSSKASVLYTVVWRLLQVQLSTAGPQSRDESWSFGGATCTFAALQNVNLARLSLDKSLYGHGICKSSMEIDRPRLDVLQICHSQRGYRKIIGDTMVKKRGIIYYHGLCRIRTSPPNHKGGQACTSRSTQSHIHARPVRHFLFILGESRRRIRSCLRQRDEQLRDGIPCR